MGGYNWMITDEWRGQGVYRSDDLQTWERNGIILDQPGRRCYGQPTHDHIE
ncbi:hypothetical protein [Paenibacillus sedimenti]|uniref:hypothetical protein n=1 Tax=Paenibacillus sedimenti TaxID=2770274 RepID=UPI001CB714CE|nr:hypothetical protein [Paenibacillus sedimenti]